MEHNEEQKSLERFTEKYIKEIQGEVPSFNFTNSVMDTIIQQEAESAKVFEYTPLISKKVWMVLSTLFVGFLVFLISISTSIFSKINFSLSFPEFELFNVFESISIPENIMYLITVLTFLVLGQLYFFKKRFEIVFEA
ncbi:hypothetical protein [uncultured Tenacibaculum sp.]|uniref:hypothetical protein n=1 Tax=uncultured Tenacibaculum sp. TaxID=174713 RepID=UPI0026186BAE|nr:hypothetical protein [uncultured Tenacibaculum sp.]